MKWLNLEVSTSDNERFIEADPLDQATWIKLLFYCCRVENGGLIRDAVKWGDQRWLKTVGISKAEADRECRLWEVSVGHIRVWGYPVKHEHECKRLRRIGVKGAQKRWDSKILKIREEMP